MKGRMTHVLFKDLVPYDVPTSLEALRGPADGQLELRQSLDWGPDRHVDLAQLPDQVSTYQSVVREGTTTQQEAFLNEELLRRLWPELTLPTRCRNAWETALPELRAARTAPERP